MMTPRKYFDNSFKVVRWFLANKDINGLVNKFKESSFKYCSGTDGLVHLHRYYELILRSHSCKTVKSAVEMLDVEITDHLALFLNISTQFSGKERESRISEFQLIVLDLLKNIWNQLDEADYSSSEQDEIAENPDLKVGYCLFYLLNQFLALALFCTNSQLVESDYISVEKCCENHGIGFRYVRLNDHRNITSQTFKEVVQQAFVSLEETTVDYSFVVKGKNGKSVNQEVLNHFSDLTFKYLLDENLNSKSTWTAFFQANKKAKPLIIKSTVTLRFLKLFLDKLISSEVISDPTNKKWHHFTNVFRFSNDIINPEDLRKAKTPKGDVEQKQVEEMISVFLKK